MRVEQILLLMGSVCAVWLAVLMRRSGNRLGAIEHVLLAVGFADIALFTNLTHSYGAFVLFAAMVGALVDWYWVRSSWSRDRNLRGDSR